MTSSTFNLARALRIQHSKFGKTGFGLLNLAVVQQPRKGLLAFDLGLIKEENLKINFSHGAIKATKLR